ncbi:SdrD B-like domain-containing protein [Ketobacter sp.]
MIKQPDKVLLAVLITASSSVIQSQQALAGVELVEDFAPGQGSSAFSSIEVVDGNLSFTAGPEGIGNVVHEYVVDANNNLTMVGRNDNRFKIRTDFDERTYVARDNSVYVEDDGQGYLLISEFPRADYGSYGYSDYYIDSFYSENDKLFFIVREEAVSRTGLYIHYLLYEVDTVNNTADYVTSQNPYLFGEPTDDTPDIKIPDFYYRLGDDRVILASTANTGQEFWVVKGEGTDRRIQLLADINPGSTGSFSRWLLDFNGESYFTANGAVGRELYKINNDIEIERITDIHPNGGSFVTYEEVAFISNGNMYFLARSSGNSGYGLWKIDDTGSLVAVKPAIRDTFGFSYNDSRNTLSKIAETSIGPVFVATDAISQEVSVWFTDGTSDGTVQLPFKNAVGALALGNEKLLISVPNSPLGYNLWIVDLKDISSPQLLKENAQEIHIFADSVNTTTNTAAVSIYDDSAGYELWTVDGTTSTMNLIGEFAGIYPGHINDEKPVGRLGNKFVFVADDGSSGAELWVSDNTAAGTTLVKDIAAGERSGYINGFGATSKVIDDRYYFLADDTVNGQQMWVTDGTVGGTHMFEPIKSEFTLRPDKFVQFNGDLYFVGDSEEFGVELFRYTPDSDNNPPSKGTGSLGDYVWQDSNGDGIQNAGELGLEGVTVHLHSCIGDFIASTTTDSMGAYHFDNLAEDSLKLQFMLPIVYRFSPEKAADDYTLDSNANETTGFSSCYDMSLSWKRLAVDAGMVPEATLAVVKAIYFSDTNELWVRAESDVMPEGSANITATVAVNGENTSLGQVSWKAVQGYYQTSFKNVMQTPSSVAITSEMGGSVTAKVEIQ